LPSYRVDVISIFFDDGGAVYHFTVPDNVNMNNHIANIRERAKKLGYRWRIAHNIGRAWIVKVKV